MIDLRLLRTSSETVNVYIVSIGVLIIYCMVTTPLLFSDSIIPYSSYKSKEKNSFFCAKYLNIPCNAWFFSKFSPIHLWNQPYTAICQRYLPCIVLLKKFHPFTHRIHAKITPGILMNSTQRQYNFRNILSYFDNIVIRILPYYDYAQNC